MKVLISYLFMRLTFGLILNNTSEIPSRIYEIAHVTAKFGTQSYEDNYRTTAPLVLMDSCVDSVHSDENVGAIVLVKESEDCSLFEQARVISAHGGVGLVIGVINVYTSLEVRDQMLDIPCVLIRMERYSSIKNLLVSQEITATISTDGELILTSERELPVAEIPVLVILFTAIWGVVALKWWCHHWCIRRRAERVRKKRICTLPEIVWTKDFVDESTKRVDYLTNDCCPICLENFEEQVRVKRLPCGHGYHGECIMPWMADHNRDSCPFCRQKISDKLSKSNSYGFASRCFYCRQGNAAEHEDVPAVQMVSLASISTSDLISEQESTVEVPQQLEFTEQNEDATYISDL